MSGRRRRDGEPPAPGSFADAMYDVDPLPERDRLRPPPAPAAPGGPPRPVPDDPPPTLHLVRRGGHAEGRADDVSQALLVRLRTRRGGVDHELDLHGLPARRARRAVEEAIDAARAAGQRHLLVIHGRGARSPGTPVLKESLPDWLAAPACAQHVLAFCPAPPRLGGPGATLVWLRRSRRRP